MKKAKIKTKKISKERNAYVLPAKKRKAGKMRSKSEKRKNGKNKQTEYLNENSDESS